MRTPLYLNILSTFLFLPATPNAEEIEIEEFLTEEEKESLQDLDLKDLSDLPEFQADTDSVQLETKSDKSSKKSAKLYSQDLENTEEAHRQRLKTKDFESTLSPSLEEIKTSQRRPAVIAKGRIVYRLSDRRAFRLGRDLNVEYYALADGLGFHYLHNFRGGPLYYTKLENLEHTHHVRGITPVPASYTEYRPLKTHRSDQIDDLWGDLQVQLHAQSYNGEVLRELTNAVEDSSGQGLRFSGLHFVEWGSAIAAGLNLNVEEATYSSGTAELLEYRALSVGPSLEWRLASRKDLHFRFGLHGQFSLASEYTAKSDRIASDNGSSSQTGLEITLAVHIPWAKNESVVGFNLRRQWLSYGELAARDFLARREDTIGFFLGQRFNHLWEVVD